MKCKRGNYFATPNNPPLIRTVKSGENMTRNVYHSKGTVDTFISSLSSIVIINIRNNKQYPMQKYLFFILCSRVDCDKEKDVLTITS